MTAAARRNTFVTIQKPNPETTVDAYGQPVAPDEQDRFVLHSTQWAAMTTQGSPLWQRLGITRAETSHVLRFLNCAETRAIVPTMRLVIDGRPLEVLAAYDLDNSGQEIQVECRASA